VRGFPNFRRIVAGDRGLEQFPVGALLIRFVAARSKVAVKRLDRRVFGRLNGKTRVRRTGNGLPADPARARLVSGPSAKPLQTLLSQIVKRILRLLTRQGYLIEEQGMTYLAETDSDLALAPLQSAACTYRIALGPRAG
jgi:hypothetical protein